MSIAARSASTGSKSAWRLRLLRERKRLTAEEIRAKSARLCALLCRWPPFQEAQTVALYYPVNGEVDLLALMDIIVTEPRKMVLFPKVTSVIGRELRFYPVNTLAQLQPGLFNIPEPPATVAGQPDLVFVPGTAFDHRGYRLGYGRGYYDRFLGTTTAVKVGVGYEFQIVPKIPAEQYDVRLDYLCTEKEVISCY